MKHILAQRVRLADILGDMDEELLEDELVQRKVETINAWVAYVYVCEPVQRNQPTPKQAATQISGMPSPISHESS